MFVSFNHFNVKKQMTVFFKGVLTLYRRNLDHCVCNGMSNSNLCQFHYKKLIRRFIYNTPSPEIQWQYKCSFVVDKNLMVFLPLNTEKLHSVDCWTDTS